MWQGEVEINPDDLKNSSIVIKIDARTINTQNGTRDNHLRGKDFLDTKKHPEATFRSKEIQVLEKASESEKNGFYLIRGDLTIRGVTQEIEVPVNIKNIFNKNNIPFFIIFYKTLSLFLGFKE